MKQCFKYIILGIAALLMTSCYESAEIKVQNNIDNVVLEEIKWGDHYLSWELYPGETSSSLTISDYDEDFPVTNYVSFIMKANNQSVYLQTEELFTLNEDDDLLIVLNENTKVINPNQD